MATRFATVVVVGSLASGVVAYAGGRWWLAGAPAPPPALVEAAVPATAPEARPALTAAAALVPALARARTQQGQPPPVSAAASTRPIVLPRMGSLDLQLLGGRKDLSLFRSQARSYFLERAMDCRRFHDQGDTVVEASLNLAMKDGELRIRGVDSIAVRLGAPLNEATLACLRAPYQQAVSLPPPAPPADAPAEHRAAFDGKWKGFADFEGDVMVEAGFGDNACKPGEAPAPAPAPPLVAPG